MVWFRQLQLICIHEHFSSLTMTFVEISQPMVILGLFYLDGWLSYDQWLHITIEMSWSYINLVLVINSSVTDYL